MTTAGHALHDDPRVPRAIAAAGALGEIASVEIVCGAAYPPYEGGPLPAWYRDASYPFRDLGARCLSIMHAVLGPIEDVTATWRASGGDPELAFDDWHARVRCARGEGQFRLRFQARPTPSQLVIHGAKRTLRVELPAKPRRRGRQPEAGGEAPTTAELAIARWVDKIARAADAEHRARLQPFTLAAKVPFLVTGAAGALGRAVTDRLLGDGHKVRAFQRRIPTTPRPGVEYAIGNLGDPAAVDRAVRGAATVIHCGATTKGSWREHKSGTVIGTQNVLAACKQHGVTQLVHISSMSVIDWAGSAGHGPVSEAANLEPRPGERGDYTRAKLEAERAVVDAARAGVPAVILRPGQIFGGGIPLINGAVARRAGGRWLVLGDGKLELPLVYIDDVVDAIVAAIARQRTQGEIIQIIDPAHLTQEDVLGLAGGDRPIVRVPRPLVLALGKLSELPLAALGRQSPIAMYRLQSALARLHYESDRAQHMLGWIPKVGVREGIKRVQRSA
ncbi:MAG TPA: NAD-dependent epimerase/dehydratase family protein [Kofleriaceae bacterium]|nr:NAD-dependent epimerase/dehydratase family protein [Kofleriaceae bacterium]